MKKKYYKLLKLSIPIILILLVITGFNKIEKKDCEDAKNYASNAYDYYRKSYRSDNLDDAQYYAKKGMNESSSAEDESNNSDCDCADAESSASDAYSYGRKAYNSDNLEDSQYYIKKAISFSEAITSNAEDCEEE